MRIREREKQNAVEAARCEIASERSERTDQRSGQADVGFRLGIVRHLFHRDPCPNEWYERWRADLEPAPAGGDVVPHLVHQNEKDEADCVSPAEDERIRDYRKQHGAAG